MHIAAGPHGGRLLHMAAAAVSMVCQLGSRSRGSLPEAMAARGGRISTPASQALGERLSGRKTGSVREGQPEARLTIWRAPLTKRPAPLAPQGPGTTACSRLAPVRTLSAVERRGPYVIRGFGPVFGRTVAEREPRVHGHVIFWLQTPLYGSWSYKMESNSYFWG